MCIYVSLCVHMHVCVGVLVDVCMWWPEDNLCHHSLRMLFMFYFFETGSLIFYPEFTSELRQSTYLSSARIISTHHHTWPLFTWVLGIPFHSLSLHAKNFSN